MFKRMKQSLLVVVCLFCLPLTVKAEIADTKLIMTYWPNRFEQVPYPIPGSLNADGSVAQNKDLTQKLNKITVFAYAFLQVDKNGHVYFDHPQLDLSAADLKGFCKDHPASCPNTATQYHLGNFDAFVKLDNDQHTLKKIISIGGEGSEQGLSAAVNHPQEFVSSAYNIIHAYHLDGIDIDFEQVSYFTAVQADKLTEIIQLLRQRLGEKAFISIESFADNRIIHSFGHQNWVKVAKAAYVSLMGYEFQSHESPPPVTASGSNLYHDPAEPNLKDFYHISDNLSVKYLTYLGVPVDKIILGIPAFFHAYGGVGAKNNGLYQPYDALKTPIYSSWKGRGPYVVMQTLLAKGFVSHVIRLHDVISAVFAYNPSLKQWITYEDEQSVAAKAQYAKNHHLAGMMMWNVVMDVPTNDPASLLKSMHAVLFAR